MTRSRLHDALPVLASSHPCDVDRRSELDWAGKERRTRSSCFCGSNGTVVTSGRRSQRAKTFATSVAVTALEPAVTRLGSLVIIMKWDATMNNDPTIAR